MSDRVLNTNSFSVALNYTKNEVFHQGFLQYMWLNPQETADFVTFTGEILNGKLHFLCSACTQCLFYYSEQITCYVHKRIITKDTKLEAYLEPIRTSTMELFYEKS